MPRRESRNRGPSDTGPSHPGKLLDTAGSRKRARVPRGSCDPLGTRTRAGVAQAIWSTPRGLGYPPEFPGTAGPPRRPSGTGPNLPGRLVDNVVCPTKTQSPGTAGRPHGHSDPGPSRLGQLVDTVGPRTRPRITCDSLSNPRALRHGPESPWRTGQSRGPWVTSANHPGGLVEHWALVPRPAGLTSSPG